MIITANGKRYYLMTPLSSKFNRNTLIVKFNELKYFINYKTFETNTFTYCSNLEEIDIVNVQYQAHNGNTLNQCTKIKKLITYQYLGLKGSSSSATMYFTDTDLEYLLLPRALGQTGGSRSAQLQSYNNCEFIDIGALINAVYNLGRYSAAKYVVLRHPSVVTCYSWHTYKRRSKVFVPANLLEQYKVANVWKSYPQDIFAIGGTEWQEMFSSTSDPSSEYADIEYYAPELYNEYVEGYEESKTAALEQLASS